MPLPVRLLLVLIHLRTNLTTRALAALFGTSQSTADRIIHHLVPVLADALRPAPDDSAHPWIIDGTLIPVHDQSITAISKNYRRSVNSQIIICAHRRRVIVAGQCWPGNRNDVVVARHTVAQLLLDRRVILGDGGYRGIPTITGPQRDHSGRIIHDNHYRKHRRIRARVELDIPPKRGGMHYEEWSCQRHAGSSTRSSGRGRSGLSGIPVSRSPRWPEISG